MTSSPPNSFSTPSPSGPAGLTPTPSGPGHPAPSQSGLRRPAFLLFLILALGAGLRLVALDRIPPGDWYDEAINGLDALRILEQPGWPLYFDTENHPREPLFMYCVAGMFTLLGPTATTLRATSALIGILTIFVVWLWARDLAGERRALLVALALALMRWHIHFSRLSFRTNLTPLFIALVLWAAWKLARTRRVRWAVAAGLFLGFGFTTYLAFRVVPVLLAAAALHAWWNRRAKGKDESGSAAEPARDRSTESASPAPASVSLIPSSHVSPSTSPRLLAVFFLALVVGLAPTALDAVRHPDHLLKRAGEVSPFSKGFGPGARLVASQARDVALMFFIRGDHVAKHNIPGGIQWFQLYGWRSPGIDEAIEWQEADHAARAMGQPLPDPHGHGLPVFDPLAALFFGIGLIALLARAQRDTAAFTVLAWMGLIGLTSVLSYGAPNYLRTLGMVPAVAFTLVEGVEWSRRRVERRWGRGVAIGLVALFFVHFGAIEAKRYFRDWPAYPTTWTEFNTEFADLARFIRELPPEIAIQVPDYIRDHPTFAFETHGRMGIFGFGNTERSGAGEGKGPGAEKPGAMEDKEMKGTKTPDASKEKEREATETAKAPEEKETKATETAGAPEEKEREGMETGSATEGIVLGLRNYGEVLVVAPLPPYPPAPVSRKWLESRRPVEVLRRPDGQPWALLLPGPAPSADAAK